MSSESNEKSPVPAPAVNPRAEAVKKAVSEGARKRGLQAATNDARNRGGDPNVQNNPVVNASLGTKQKKLTLAEKLEIRRKQKRQNMTPVEEEMYAAYTDPVTGLPPRDVRGDWDSAVIDY